MSRAGDLIEYSHNDDDIERLHKLTRLYNFINDTLVAESTVLGH